MYRSVVFTRLSEIGKGVTLDIANVFSLSNLRVIRRAASFLIYKLIQSPILYYLFIDFYTFALTYYPPYQAILSSAFNDDPAENSCDI